MEKETLEQLTALVAQDFEPVSEEPIITEEQLLEALAERVEWMIEHRLESLLSMMYRMDVDERKVDFALSPLSPEPAHIAIARLILDRQKQRVFTRQHYKQHYPDKWDWED
jgi:hypothetical protein